MGLQAELASLVASYTQRHRICGVSYCIRANHQRLAAGAYGATRWEGGRPVRTDTAFDLASLTKVMATLPALVQLQASGRLDRHEVIGHYLPHLPAAYHRPTIEELLVHRGGMPALIPDELLTEPARAAVIKALETLSPERPGERFLYSDIGFMLLGWVVEAVSRMTLGEYCRHHIFRPLGLAHTTFGPITEAHCAATRFCPVRGRILEGEAQNVVTWALGGQAGHAGLFSTAEDVCAFGEAVLLPGDALQPADLWDASLRDHGHQRGLGWMLSGWEGWGGIVGLPAGAFGHTGFTGTSLVMVPASGTVAVLLTNRTHLEMNNPAIVDLRRDFHTLVFEHLAGSSSEDQRSSP